MDLSTALMETAMSVLPDGVAEKRQDGEIADCHLAKPRSTTAEAMSTRGDPTTITRMKLGEWSYGAHH
jgi:hypothetical protein